MKLMVGLGNPEKRYEKTRHNAGFMLLDTLHETLEPYQISNWKLSKKFNAQISGCTINGEKVILAKPMTYMNASGEAVQLLGHFYKISPHDLIVAHDEKDIPLGDIRIERNRSSAGHNGIKSIISHIGSQDFTRIRIGIKSKNEKKMQDTAKFVLSKFGLFEKKELHTSLERIIPDILNLLKK